MSKQISLTKGASAVVDDSDYDRLIQIGRWCLSSNGYAIHYTKINGQRKTLYMHRVVMDACYPLQVDHIDRDRLNNQHDNLRFATRSQNQANKNIQNNNTSAYKGVNWNKGKWEARIRLNGLRLNLGRFRDPLRAAMVYDAASRLLYDDFAGCNFPEHQTSQRLTDYVLKRLAQ
ncbi:MAG: HNH endonuclease [Aggregatilineales bacterium]